MQELNFYSPACQQFGDLFPVLSQGDPQRRALHTQEFQVDRYMRAFSADRFERPGKPVRPGPLQFIQEEDLIYGWVKGYGIDQGFFSKKPFYPFQKSSISD